MLPSPMLNMSSNGLPDSMPFYFKECTSASASSSSQYTNSKQMHGRGIERKLSSTSVASKQPPNNMHPEMPLRVQPLFEDADRISDPETLKRWVEEFMPKPEPPRFFRPLCSRLARENQVLDEQMGHYIEKSNKHIEELRRRLNMSIRQVREEQKVELNRLKQEREREFSDLKKDEKHQQTLRRDSSSNLPMMDEKAVVAAATPNHHRHHPHSASTSSQQRCNNHSCASAGELAKEKNGRKERKENNGRRRESRWDRKESHYHPERGMHKGSC